MPNGISDNSTNPMPTGADLQASGGSAPWVSQGETARPPNLAERFPFKWLYLTHVKKGDKIVVAHPVSGDDWPCAVAGIINDVSSMLCGQGPDEQLIMFPHSTVCIPVAHYIADKMTSP